MSSTIGPQQWVPWRARQGGTGGLFLVLASAVGFATLPVLTKVAYAVGAPLLTVLSYRFLIAAALLWPLARLGKPQQALTLRLHVSLLGLGGMFVLTSLAMFMALERITASMASLVFYTYPSLVAVGSFLFLRERLRMLHIGLIGLSFAGCFLMFGVRSFGVDFLDGGWMALASASAYAAYIMLGHRLSYQVAPIIMVSYVVTVAAVCFAAAAIARESLIVLLPVRGWLAIMMIALLATALSLYAFLTGAMVIGPSRAALVSTLEPAITVVLATAILREQIATVQYIGGAMIVGAVLGLRLERRATRTVSDSPVSPTDQNTDG